jgi:nucleoside-specific outer membrane channel protein Tsx
MKIDMFAHIFRKSYFDKMVSVALNGKDIHKRVRNVPCIMDLSERFRMMDMFGSDMPFDPEKGTAYARWMIKILDSLEITLAERAMIYEGNAREC